MSRGIVEHSFNYLAYPAVKEPNFRLLISGSEPQDAISMLLAPGSEPQNAVSKLLAPGSEPPESKKI